jgi:hypothetical protein
MVDIMTDREKNELLNNVEQYRKLMSAPYKQAYNDWLLKRNIVGPKMNLTYDQMLYLTIREAARYYVFDLKRRIGLTDYNVEEVARRNGTTKTLEACSKNAEVFKKYDSICSRYAAEFDRNIAKTTLNNKR